MWSCVRSVGLSVLLGLKVGARVWATALAAANPLPTHQARVCRRSPRPCIRLRRRPDTQHANTPAATRGTGHRNHEI